MVLVKVTVSLYIPEPRLFALLLMETVTVVVAPGAKVPLSGVERSTQSMVFETLQLMGVLLVFCKVYTLFEGLKGPPCVPEEAKPFGGVTKSTGAAFTVSSLVGTFLRIVVPSPN